MKYDLAKTLFVTDLDGTLLRSDGTLAKETTAELARMIAAGLKFTYATARSRQTANQVAGALTEALGGMPVILHNGTFIVNSADGAILAANWLEPIDTIRAVLEEYEIEPIVYSRCGERQMFSYLPDRLSVRAKAFHATRRGDPRDHPVTEREALWAGDIFYITCIDEREKLLPAYEKLKDVCGCLFGQEYYSDSYWLELLAFEATKAHAIGRLRDMLGCERVVVFGDGHNDISMFEAADEGYAVAGAEDALKAIATAVIGSNDENGVVRWLRENVF